MARPAGGGGSGGGGGPATGGPYWWSSGAWGLAAAADLPAVPDQNVQDYLDALDTSVGTLSSDLDTAEATITDLVASGYTRETFTGFVLGNAPTYAVLKTLTIAPGTSRALTGVMLLTGGTAASPTSGAVSFDGSAYVVARRSSSGGAPTLNGTPTTVGTVSALGVQVAVTGNDVTISLRATSAPTCNVTLLYRWTLGTP